MENLIKESPHLVAYIDLLGVKNLIYSDNSQKALKRIHEMYELASQYCKGNSFNEKLVFKSFSDNFVISVPLSNNEVENVQKLALVSSFVSIVQVLYIAQAKTLLRGCITAGNFFVNDNIVWGEALVRGYQVENSLAVNPRVVLDTKNKVIEKLAKRTDIFDYNSFFINDVDGFTILNCFSDANLDLLFNNERFGKGKQEKFESILQEGLERTSDNEKAYAKWVWTINQYNQYKRINT